jgi:hypothetical protein
MTSLARARAVVARPEARYWLAFLACAVAALVPIWSAHWLPMVDLPQHVALVSVWRHLTDPAWGFSSTYEIHYGSPYLLGPVLLRAFSEVTDPVTAAHLLVSLFVVGLPLSIDLLLRSAGADRWWSLAGFPAVFGFTFHWGFLPYFIAVPLAIVLVAVCFPYARQPSRAGALGVAVLATLLYGTHAVALGFGIGAAALVIVAHAPSWRSAVGRLLPLGAPLVLLAAWAAWTLRTEETAAAPWLWEVGAGRILDLPGMLFGTPPDVMRDVPFRADALAIVVVVGLAVLVAVARPGFRAGIAYAGPPALVLGAYLLAPDTAFGSSFLYERAPVFLVPFAALLLGPPRSETRARLAHGGLVALVLACMAVWTVRYLSFDQEASSFEPVLARMAPTRRVIDLPFRSMSAAIPGAPFYLHYGSWYQATRGGVVATSFASAYNQLVRYRKEGAPQVTDGVDFAPQFFDWEVDGRNEYFLVRAFEDTGPFLFRKATEPVELVVRQGPWWLFRRVAAAPVAPAVAPRVSP